MNDAGVFRRADLYWKQIELILTHRLFQRYQAQYIEHDYAKRECKTKVLKLMHNHMFS